jgi:hypothetical protein
MKATIALIVLCLLIMTGCKKDSQNEQDLSNNGITSKVNTWLATQQHASTPLRNQKIDFLKQHIDYDHITFEELNNGERFIIVPVKSGFKTVNNKNKNPLNTLVLTLDRTDKIRSGKIIQFVPEIGATPERLEGNTLHSIFNNKPVTMDGSFTALAIWDQYMFQLSYKDGKMVNSKTMEPEGGYANYRNARTSGCIDWFIVTTLYVNGQIINQYYEYVGTTCDGCTPQDPNAESIGCEGNGDGSPGGSPFPEPEVMSKQVQWTVKADALLGWHVDSYEQLNGVRPFLPVLSYFTSIVHQNDAIFNSAQSNNPAYTTWQRLAITTGLTTGGGAASSTISGKINNAIEGERSISNAQPWTAVIEFPQ